jgi:hypothetical protein
MTTKLVLLAVSCALLIAATAAHLIKRNRLSEEYSTIWIVTSLLVLGATIFSRPILRAYSYFKESAGSGPEILLFFALVFIVFFLMLVSVKLSEYKRSLVRLTQELGLLRHELGRRRQREE